MNFDVDDFQPISLDDKDIFVSHYAKYPPIHSDYVFTTLISWKNYANYHYLKYEDYIIICSKIEGVVRFRPPIGKRSRDIFDRVLKLAEKQNSDYPFGVIDGGTKDWMSNNYKNLVFKRHRGFFDYVYLSDDLADLSGSKYAKIRNRLNKFERKYHYDCEFISHNNKGEILDFLKRWCIWKDCESDPLLEYEKKAVNYAISNFDDLGLSVLAVRINDRIEAISVFEKMNKDTVVVHFEKGSSDYDGVYKLINREVASLVKNDYKFLNRESDMDVPGLRKAKMSYRPHHFVEVYHLDMSDFLLE